MGATPQAVVVNVLFCSGLEKAEGVDMALRAMLGTDVNSVASPLVVLAVKCRALMATKIYARRWKRTALLNDIASIERQSTHACMTFLYRI